MKFLPFAVRVDEEVGVGAPARQVVWVAWSKPTDEGVIVSSLTVGVLALPSDGEVTTELRAGEPARPPS